MKKVDWFNEIVTHLEGACTREFWCDGEQILCSNEAQANFLADLIEKLYEAQGESITTTTGYYDEQEDKRQGTVDSYSGMWYVDIG